MNAINSIAACALSTGLAVHFVYFAIGMCTSMAIVGWIK